MAIVVDLAKLGRQRVYATGQFYRIYVYQRGNLEIERIADGASAFLQGDDAQQLGRPLLDELVRQGFFSLDAGDENAHQLANAQESNLVDWLCRAHDHTLRLEA